MNAQRNKVANNTLQCTAFDASYKNHIHFANVFSFCVKLAHIIALNFVAFIDCFALHLLPTPTTYDQAKLETSEKT